MGEHHHEADRVIEEDAVLDIGGDIGALILYADERYRGREVEISGLDDEGRRTHTAILQRRAFGAIVFAGIFPQLRAGRYRLLGAEPGVETEVEVVGGRVATVDWRRTTTAESGDPHDRTADEDGPSTLEDP